MVSSRDSKTGPEVVNDGPRSGLPLQRGPKGGDAASERYTDDEDNLEALLAAAAAYYGFKEKLTLSQLTCWYQFERVMGRSVMCGFLGSYLGLRFGSAVLAMEPFCLT